MITAHMYYSPIFPGNAKEGERHKSDPQDCTVSTRANRHTHTHTHICTQRRVSPAFRHNTHLSTIRDLAPWRDDVLCAECSRFRFGVGAAKGSIPLHVVLKRTQILLTCIHSTFEVFWQFCRVHTFQNGRPCDLEAPCF